MNTPSESGTHKWRKVRAFWWAIPVLLVILCIGGYLGIRSFAPAAPYEGPTATATPFQPATETATGSGRLRTRTPTETVASPLPLVTPTASGEVPPWAPYAGPVHPASTEIPKPVTELTQSKESLTIALLGIDKSETAGAYRTDAILILTIDRERKTAAMISFPRDLYVYIPAYGMQRINIAFGEARTIHYPGGSFALFRDTMKYNFGLRVDHYALINFQGFKDMVDRLDGIDVEAAKPLKDFRKGYGDYSVPAGITHMDGATALWYVRARQTTSDFDRGRRQQEVILAIVQRLLDLRAVPNLPGFYQIFMQYLESDLTLEMLTPYAELAGSVSLSSLRRYRITLPDGCSNWITPEGGMVLLPKYDAIHAILEEALNPAA